MFEPLRRRLNYANVVATLALFIALCGSSYAVTKFSGSQLKNRSVAGEKLKRNTLGARQIKESRLGIVRRARNADRLNGFDAGQLVDRLVLRCPEATFAIADVCVETQPRPATTYRDAAGRCMAADGLPGPGRRLPTYNELLMAATADIAHFTPGELTSHIYPSASTPSGYNVLSMTDAGGSVALVPGGFEGQRPFRCVLDPRN